MSNSLLRGMHVPPMPGFGLAGKVPGRYAHLVQLKKSVRERAWAHWLATTGTVNQNTMHKSNKSKTTTSNSTGKSSRRDGPTIRLPGATSSTTAATATATTTGGKPIPTNPQTTISTHTEPTELSTTNTAMEVDTDMQNIIQKTKTKFHINPPAKRPCVRRTEAVTQAFVIDLYEDV